MVSFEIGGAYFRAGEQLLAGAGEDAEGAVSAFLTKQKPTFNGR